MSVKNHAVRGGSSRIFSRDIWANALSSIKSGDIVVFELGHYDAKIPGSIADKNAGCPGSVPGESHRCIGDTLASMSAWRC